ncbi:MAG: hypothetical protein QGI45_13960, partial [Myxococcota bacterium]|nr:hypothetical protein [Myxococcota bacterium]
MADSNDKQGSYWLYLGLFTLVAISLFKKVLFTNAVLFYGDFIELYYGAKELSIHLLKQQGLGAWNPYIDGGQPLLADANFAYVLYPGNLIFMFTSVGKGFSVLLVIHHIIAACGMYTCSLKLSKNSIVSLSSALFFVLSGFYLTSMYRPPCFYALSWLPWICWLWCIVEEHPRQGFFYLLIISVLQILTG